MEVSEKPFLKYLGKTSPHDTIETLPFLTLGRAPPLVPGLESDMRVGAPCAGIVLLDEVDPAELASVLDAAPDPAVPIADIGGNRQTRSDYAGDIGATFDAELIAELRHRFEPILIRLAAIPFRCTHEDRAELTILRLAYARNIAIEAVFAPNSRNIVEYPLLGQAASSRQRLEGLADLDLLRRRHFTRTHLCGHCDSARLHAFEACPSCDSADLVEESIVHHYRCGWQEPEPNFIQNHMLICPKCRRELRHYGVDYDKPGSVLVCHGCHKANSEPTIQFACLDCAHVTPTSEARTVNWYHYDLTEDGLQSLRDGRIPRFDISDHLDGHPRAFTSRDFRLLANEGIRVAHRYGRPFAVGQLTFANAHTLPRDHGLAIVDNTFRLAIDLIAEALRESDFIGIDDTRSIFIGFPETPQKDVVSTLNRLSEQIRKTVSIPLELNITVAEGEDAAKLLMQEQRQ